MRYRADLTWAPLLVVSAGLSLSAVLPAGGDWLPLLMVVLAYPAGRRMASLALALWVFTAVAFAGLALAFWFSPHPLSDWLTLVTAEFGAAVLPWWAGRYRRLFAEQAEHERGIAAEQARLRERARIAQDMHDSLGHELALIALHGGALELASGLTDEQRRAAGELRTCAVRATHRLHEIVQVLGSTAGLRPPNESVDALVQRATSAGLRVRLRHEGPAPAWSPMTSQAAHRVVQEALTNAARHAPGAPVTVTVGPTRIDVVNGAATQPGAGGGTGHGLIGLDERVRLVGGRLSAGPRAGDGWAVTAVFPHDATERDEGPSFDTRQTRRRLRQTAILPIGVGLALVTALVVAQVITVARTGLPDDRYDRLRPGQSRADVERLLPPHDINRVPRVVAVAPQPPGATCAYYLAGDRLFDAGPQVYQLCFAGEVLVSKAELEQA